MTTVTLADGRTLECDELTAYLDGARLVMPAKSLAVLHALADQAPRTMTKARLYQRGWGVDLTARGCRSLDQAVCKIRGAIGGGAIVTQPAYGYALDGRA